MLSRPLSLILAGALAVATGAAVPAAQQPAPVFRGGVELITVDVAALDDDGRQVVNLAAADFIVQVDGDPRPVATAEYVRSTDPLRGAGARRPAPPAGETYFSTNAATDLRGRLMVLLVDQGNIRAGTGRPVMNSAKQFVGGLMPEDRVAVVAIPGAGELVDFTTDRDRVNEALLRITGRAQRIQPRHNISLVEAKALYEKTDPRLAQDAIRRECALSGPEFRQCVLEVENDAATIIMELRSRSVLSVQGIREVLRSIGRLPGPKSVILFTEGMFFQEIGGEANDLATAAADARASLDIMLLDVPMFDAAVSVAPVNAREDRDLMISSLEALAAQARGSLFRINTTAGFAFDRIARAIDGYYLLGVEARPEDRDGRRHRIAVRSSRRGVTIRARRTFLAPVSVTPATAADAVERALQSPVPIADLPLRLATAIAKEPGSGKVRLLVAVEAERRSGKPADYTTGLLLVSQSGQGLAPAVERRTLAVKDGDPAVAVWSTMIAVDPGTYTLALAMADGDGRIGSVSRKVVAPLMSAGVEMSDLLLTTMAAGEAPKMLPNVEPIVTSGQMAALVELYGHASQIAALEVALDIALDDQGEPLAVVPMVVRPGASPEIAQADAQFTTAIVPPGSYLARSTVRQAGKTIGRVTRPFRIAAAPAAEAGAAPHPAGPLPREITLALLAGLTPFDRADLLSPAVMTPVWAAAASRHGVPATTMAKARAGDAAGAAVDALAGGDRALAAFLHGLASFTSGASGVAAVQFQEATKLDPEFAPARLFLGASLAALDRHREAAGLVQSASTAAAPIGGVSRLAGEEWIKAGLPQLAVAPLQLALQQPGAEARTPKLLGLAYALGNRPADAVGVLTPYLAQHPSDQPALLAAMLGVYVRHRGAPAPDLAGDRLRADTWMKAYTGPMQPLVGAWNRFVQER